MASTPPDVDLDSAGTEVSDFPLVAVPPSTPHSKLRESADVSTSDAFQLLDEVSLQEKLLHASAHLNSFLTCSCLVKARWEVIELPD